MFWKGKRGSGGFPGSLKIVFSIDINVDDDNVVIICDLL